MSATDPIDPRIAALIDAARRKLVDTGTRNRLIHASRKGRGRFLNIVNERADDVFRILCVDGRKMRFHASESADEDEGNTLTLFQGVDLSAFEGVDEPDESRFADRLLDTALGTDALQKRLLQMARDARTAEGEQGINILFLALGFLAWFEDENSKVQREAPLVLVPVDLVRNERTSTYDLKAREEDVVANLPLQARLNEDFGLALAEIDANDEWRPSRYFRAVRDAVAPQSRWRVEDNGIQLGFFSSAKQMMRRDLKQDQWPEGRLGGDATIQGLMLRGFEEEPPLFGDREKLDPRLAPEDIVQVIDADAPQTKAIEEVRRGRNLVVQGPPGTGKSQTITNIIAAAAFDGKTVLFMAEKMAALDVVHHRLRECGLGDLCLELHSRHVRKQKVLKEIDLTLKRRTEKAGPQNAVAAELRAKRDALNRVADLLHTRVANCDYTPFAAMADLVGFIGSGRRPPKLPRDGLDELTAERRAGIERLVSELAQLLAAAGSRRRHPFAGCRALELQPVALQRLGDALSSANAALGAALAAGKAFAAGMAPRERGTGTNAESPPRSVAGLRRSAKFLDLAGKRPRHAGPVLEAAFGRGAADALAQSLEVGAAWAKERLDAEAFFREHAWAPEAPEARPLLAELERGAAGGLASFCARLRPDYRRACRTLAGLAKGPLPGRKARAALAERLARVQRRRRELADEEGSLAGTLRVAWRGERTEFEGLRDAARWLVEVEATGIARSVGDFERAEAAVPQPAQASEDILGQAQAALDAARAVVDLLRLDTRALGLGEGLEEAPLSDLRRRFLAMAERPGGHGEWRRIETLARQLSEAGLQALLDRLDAETLKPADAAVEFAYACAEARWDRVLRSEPELSKLADLDRHQLVAAFSELGQRRVEEVRRRIRSRHRCALPRGAVGEMAVIRGEIARKRRHMPIRRLMGKAGKMVQRIKPVFLMSPISIAQFLPPKALRFDLLVVDEASQVRPEDALGAIARCGQIVIVGDQKQLPPTSFFDRLGIDEPDGEEDEDAGIAGVAEMESVLTLCEARGMSQRMLEWHYRSRDPSLIRVSNEEFYGNRLILPPSPLGTDSPCGLSFQRVPGVYASRRGGQGRPGTNRVEAQCIVDEVARHARETPGMSLGIVAFSRAQTDMLTELLEYERRRDETLNGFLREGWAEDPFVKNIENVQGDERDVIFISVGYGPDKPEGRLSSMRFGPINAEGGERRLNVLFTRARMRCRVFASFDPDDIDLSRAAHEGPRILKRFMEYAKTGQAAERGPVGAGADSPFEEDVARVIVSFGYPVDHQVGSAGFRIDLGVRHPDSPGKYIMAVECDGAAYHSALSARERDRHRQEVLEGLGWTFHRIWSTDWFHRRREGTQRLKAALADALAGPERAVLTGANAGGRAEVRDPAPVPAPEAGAGADLAPPPTAAQPYRCADLKVETGREPHRMPAAHLAPLVHRIVDIEGPMHFDLVARRVAEAFGKSRTGQRIADATRRALKFAQSATPGALLEEGGFLLTRAQSEDMPVRDRKGVGRGVDKAAMLAPMEIAAAAERIERESGRVEREELVREVGRLLGFKRIGLGLRTAIDAALDARRNQAT